MQELLQLARAGETGRRGRSFLIPACQPEPLPARTDIFSQRSSPSGSLPWFRPLRFAFLRDAIVPPKLPAFWPEGPLELCPVVSCVSAIARSHSFTSRWRRYPARPIRPRSTEDVHLPRQSFRAFDICLRVISRR